MPFDIFQNLLEKNQVQNIKCAYNFECTVLSEKKLPIYADFPMNGEIERPLGIICQGTMNTNLNIHFVNKAVMSE